MTRALALRSVLAVLALSAAACQQSPAASPPRPAALNVDADDPASRRVPGAIVVDFKDGTTATQFNEWEKGWGIDLELNSVESAEEALTIAVGVQDVEATLRQIRQNADVEYAEPLFTYDIPEDRLDEVPGQVSPPPSVEGEFTPNDPDYPKQWNLRQIDMPKAWERSHGKGVVVAVIDTGVAFEDYDGFRQVPDLKGVKFVAGYDFVNDDEHANDDHGHGTHVAGTIAQATNNGEGVAGVAFEAAIMPLKVLNHFGSGTSADIADAIRFAADHGAKVVNLSLGGGGRSGVMASAVAYARQKGVTVVCAAGNGGVGRVEYPAAYEGAVAVSAVGPSGRRAPYSSFGKELDIAGPGGDKSQGVEAGILQNTIDPRDPARSVYASFQGTSMATPHVAGVAALLYAAGAKGPDEVERALYDGARAASNNAWSEEYGHGLLNADASLKALGATPIGGVEWSPLFWAAAMLVVVLLTVGRRERPGYLNLLLKPAFLLPVLMSTVGLFFVRWVGQRFFGGSGSEALEIASLPIPDWQRIIFGRGRLANPLFYSALIPLLASAIAVKAKGLREMMAGLSLGFAGFLAYSAWAHAPGLTWMPFNFLAVPWLLVNAAVCLVVARALVKKER